MLSGFLICGHLWADRIEDWDATTSRWTRRGQHLIPVGSESTDFSASRLFAAVYPEAVDIAEVIAAPAWRNLASGDTAQRRRVATENGRRLGRPGYQPPEGGDAIAHWMKYDSHRPPADRTPRSPTPATTARSARPRPAPKASTGNTGARSGSA